MCEFVWSNEWCDMCEYVLSHLYLTTQHTLYSHIWHHSLLSCDVFTHVTPLFLLSRMHGVVSGVIRVNISYHTTYLIFTRMTPLFTEWWCIHTCVTTLYLITYVRSNEWCHLCELVTPYIRDKKQSGVTCVNTSPLSKEWILSKHIWMSIWDIYIYIYIIYIYIYIYIYICIYIWRCDSMHSHVWHHSSLRTNSCFLHMCDMTHPNVWHDSLACVAWLIPMLTWLPILCAFIWMWMHAMTSSYGKVSHVKHTNESWHTCPTHEWVMAHSNEWSHTCECMHAIASSYGKVSLVTHMNESWHTCECVMSHTWMIHVTHEKKTRVYTELWVISHTWMYAMTSDECIWDSESCHT